MKKKTSVLIVGAGTTGLVLALWLKRRGIDLRIIDKNATPGEASRAIGVQARTLEFYSQLGLSDILVRDGILANEIILRRSGQIVARAKIGALGKDLSPFPYLLFYPQDVHEAMLSEELRKHGLEVERSVTLTELQQDTNGVKATVQTAQGEQEILADYVCGTDGAHSTVRHLLNIDFPGGTYSQVFYVADAKIQDSAEDAVQISVDRGGFCIMMPVRQRGSMRFIGVVPPESENKEKIVFSDVAESIKTNTGFHIESVNWFATYRVHHRVAPHFGFGRVFLSGDAAHIHSPAGAQGMNTGIGDAINLAWKLADVLQGRVSGEILKSYEVERRAFAEVLVKTTDTAFQVVASRSKIGNFFRLHILPEGFALLSRIPFVLRLAFRTISQIRIKYRKSPLSSSAAGEVQPGDRLPWVRYEDTDNYRPLRSLDWQIHVYGDLASAPQESSKIAFHRFSFNEDAQRKSLLRDHLYLIRPDGHIALITQSASDIQSYFKKL